MLYAHGLGLGRLKNANTRGNLLAGAASFAWVPSTTVAGEADTSRGSHAHVHAFLSSLRPQPRFGEAEECGHIWGQNRAIGGMVSRARVAGLSIKHSTLHGDSLILDEEADNSGTGGGRACHFSPNPSSRLTMYNHGINHLNRQVLHSLTIRRPKLSTEFSLQGLTC